MKYKTKHQSTLIKYLKNHSDEHLTIQDMAKDLSMIPQATLYRLVDSMVEEGSLRKYIIGPNSSCCFQLNGCEHQHFHLICERCGKLIHLECDEVDHLLEHINEEHGFSVDVSKINLYGLCDDCKKGQSL